MEDQVAVLCLADLHRDLPGFRRVRRGHFVVAGNGVSTRECFVPVGQVQTSELMLDT
jgi:hypothetical protein